MWFLRRPVGHQLWNRHLEVPEHRSFEGHSQGDTSYLLGLRVLPDEDRGLRGHHFLCPSKEVPSGFLPACLPPWSHANHVCSRTQVLSWRLLWIPPPH